MDESWVSSPSLGLGSPACLWLRLFAHCSPETSRSLPLRSGMRTGVWPWKGAPAPTRAESTPPEPGRRSTAIAGEAGRGSRGAGGRWGRGLATCPLPTCGNATASPLFPLPLFFHLSNGRIFFIPWALPGWMLSVKQCFPAGSGAWER